MVALTRCTLVAIVAALGPFYASVLAAPVLGDDGLPSHPEVAPAVVQLPPAALLAPVVAPTPNDDATSEVSPIQVMGITASGLRIAAGVTGGAIDPAIVPRGNIFTGFDIRPQDDGSVNGFQSVMPWTQESVNAAVSASSVDQQVLKKTFTISSDEEMSSSLDVAVELNGAFLGGAASVEATFGYSSKTASTSHVVSGVTYANMALPGDMLALPGSLVLTQDALDLLTSDVTDFLDSYGTHFIKTRAYGCDASAAYTFKCSTQSAVQDIKASLSANYNGGEYSIGGKVSGAYNTYANSSICDYSGTAQASGLDVLNPSQAQMMDQVLMDQYWNNFENNCRANAATASKLLYVELGNWLEVPAVRAAAPKGSAAYNILKFYTGVHGTDLLALAYGGLYESKVKNAAGNVPQALLSGNQQFQSGFFDRETGQGMAPVPADYWTTLQATHTDLVSNRIPKASFVNFFSDANINSALQANPSTTATSLIQQYFNGVRQLYQDAAQAYMYTYTSISAVALSFKTDNVSPVGFKLTVNAGDTCTQTETNSQIGGFCAVDESANFGTIPMQFGIRSAIQPVNGQNIPIFEGYVADIGAGTANKQFFVYANNNAGSVDYVDLSPYIQSTYCSTCKAPARIDFSIQYSMPSITLNKNPYSSI